MMTRTKTGVVVTNGDDDGCSGLFLRKGMRERKSRKGHRHPLSASRSSKVQSDAPDQLRQAWSQERMLQCNMSSLNSVKGGYIGDYIGDYYKVIFGGY